MLLRIGTAMHVKIVFVMVDESLAQSTTTFCMKLWDSREQCADEASPKQT